MSLLSLPTEAIGSIGDMLESVAPLFQLTSRTRSACLNHLSRARFYRLPTVSLPWRRLVQLKVDKRGRQAGHKTTLDNLPSSLTHLDLSDMVIDSEDVLPPTLLTLEHESLQMCSLPKSLTDVTVGGCHSSISSLPSLTRLKAFVIDGSDKIPDSVLDLEVEVVTTSRIQLPPALTRLSMNLPHRLTDTLPATLTSLTLGYRYKASTEQLETILTLPVLRVLRCRMASPYPITSVNWRNVEVHLNTDSTEVISLSQLPVNLRSLSAHHVRFRNDAKWPANLSSLNTTSKSLSSTRLPPTLTHLGIDRVDKKISRLCHLISLGLYSPSYGVINHSVSLSQLPSTLTYLNIIDWMGIIINDVSSSRLVSIECTDIDKLPPRLTRLNTHYHNPDHVYPYSLAYLHGPHELLCSPLPDTITHLEIHGHEWTWLSNMTVPAGVVKLIVEDEIELPDHLLELTIGTIIG